MQRVTLLIPDALYARLQDPAELRALEAGLRWLMTRRTWQGGSGRYEKGRE